MFAKVEETAGGSQLFTSAMLQELVPLLEETLLSPSALLRTAALEVLARAERCTVIF